MININASRKNQAPGLNSPGLGLTFSSPHWRNYFLPEKILLSTEDNFFSTGEKLFSTGEKNFSTVDNFVFRGDNSLISGRG
jgi:hypothetical protein